MQTQLTTPFSYIYDSFLSKITDDMYMEFNEIDTYRMLEELLISSGVNALLKCPPAYIKAGTSI